MTKKIKQSFQYNLTLYYNSHTYCGAWRVYSSSLISCHTYCDAWRAYSPSPTSCHILWCLTSILAIAYFVPHIVVLDEYIRHRLLRAIYCGGWRVYSSSPTSCHILWCLTSILVIAYFLSQIVLLDEYSRYHLLFTTYCGAWRVYSSRVKGRCNSLFRLQFSNSSKFQ